MSKRKSKPKRKPGSRVGFPSLKAKRLLAILEREPLGYQVARQKGSHRRVKATGRPSFTFAFHDSAILPKLILSSN